MTYPYSEEPFAEGAADPQGRYGSPEIAQGLDDPGVRGRLAQQIAQVLTTVVRALRRPTGLMILAPVLPSVVAILLGLLAERPLQIVATIVGVLGLLLAARMWWLRARFLKAVEDPAALETELASALDITGHVDQARQQALAQLQGSASSVASARQALGSLGLSGSLDNLPRVRPFLPASLRSTFATGTLCFTIGGFLVLFNGVVILLLLFGA